MRVGIGYDAHRLVTGKRLVLGGVEIPFELGLLGWSDADVVVHAIIDALLGAASLGDIGDYFPPNDPRFKDISSLALLRQTKETLEEQGWQIGNIDVTIIARQPQLKPFIEEMRRQLSQALAIAEDQIGIKAKSANELGFVGRGEGIASLAVALIESKNKSG